MRSWWDRELQEVCFQWQTKSAAICGEKGQCCRKKRGTRKMQEGRWRARSRKQLHGMVTELNRVFVDWVLQWSFLAHRRKSYSYSIWKLVSRNLHPGEASSEGAAVIRCKRDGVAAAVFAGRPEVLIDRCTSRGVIRKNKLGLGWWL